MIDKPSILSRTMYGTRIYTHEIRKRWPDEIAMSIKGDDCGTVRNPLSEDGARTLHVWIEKTDPEQRLSDRIARHHDDAGILPDGDCFSFAEKVYGLTGQELLDHINSELNLHLEPTWNPYGCHLTQKVSEAHDDGPRMSFFRRPITNVNPEKDILLRELYNYIIGDEARERTAKLRSITDPKRARLFKSSQFDYVTPAGQFSVRKDDGLVKHSGFLTLDFDHVPRVEALFAQLLRDEYIETALAFRSPSGDGIKWIVPIDIENFTHLENFLGISGYIHKTYGILVDQSGKDVSRPCFVPHDPQAYLSPKFY